VTFHYRKEGKGRTFRFYAGTETDANAIARALPAREFHEAQQEAQQEEKQISELSAALSKATPNVFVTPIIIALNVIVFILMALGGTGIGTTDLDAAVRWGANYGPLTTNGQWWRLLTSTFLHFGVWHIFLNMCVLSGIGVFVEKLFGNYVYLAIYLVSAIVGSEVSLMCHAGNAVCAGASGAIFGVYGALIGYFAIQRGSIPKAVWAGLGKGTIGFVLYTLWCRSADETIDNVAHLGGLLAGLMMGMAFACPLDLELRSKQTHKKVAVGTLASCGLIVIALALVPRYDSPNVTLVKTGCLPAYPSIRVGDAVDRFMRNPQWESGTATDGSQFVNIRGKICFMDKEVEALLQFQINSGDATCEVRGIEINGVPQDRLMQLALLNKMYESYQK
jgi:rhomboid protease GluP